MKLRVYYEDTDCGDMVYHSNYLNYCERARSELFFQKGLLPHSNTHFFVVKECKANWIKSAKFADILDVKTELIEKKAASIIMKQDILKDEELIFSAEFKLVFLKNGKPSKIPSEIFEILEK
ncbi:YbgC/FadM family acyl-CoA thioesterase [Arcobacter porcinus]|uniref:Acyl-CoA thioesterase n=1 Tax=Arcobacter porcinus TaxID=1935204 RepID=A0A5C2HD44_9BACT|nr:YbgC/FadM family acyl-CoA thioesterase [Arcobacter porcinus]OCL86529.1 Acyl-CoA thioester hydrolase YbgC [Arcobacter porcinus]OCL96887.1 Acyl-CoA thioester hydrolase YbgC [Aliarcobacter thereius]QEP40717.1 acyl-CoA thioesterase [Arcobacter porcinus]